MKQDQTGLSLVSAIFLLVVLAALGVYSATLVRTQHASAAADEVGARVLLAAQSGLDWAAWQVLQTGAAGGACPPNNPSPACPPSPTTLAFPAAGGNSLTPFSATVTCAATAHCEAGQTVTIYQIVATGCNVAGGPCPNPVVGADYVERQLAATLER